MAALLFTDMVDSVALQNRLGTMGYSRLLQLHHQLFTKSLGNFSGARICDEAGDGLLCEFETAADAVNAALLFQAALREAKWEQEAPKVRIGIHSGQLAEVQLNEAAPGKLMGMPLNIASRVMSLAQGGQILVTRAVYEDARQFVREHPRLPGANGKPPQLRWKDHGAYLSKGTDDLIEVYEVGAAGLAPFTAPPDSEKIRRSEVRPRHTVRVKSPAKGAVLAMVCGLLAWATPGVREAFENWSYDYLFLAWSPRPAINDVTLVLMDNDSYFRLEQKRGEDWDRRLHTRLFDKLAKDGSNVVAFDISLRRAKDTNVDQALGEAIRRHGRVLLGDKPLGTDSEVSGLLPLFQKSAFAWGFAGAGVPILETPRWEPFEVESPILPMEAARASGVDARRTREKRWLRYYEPGGVWQVCSYNDALAKEDGYFRGRVVFVGSSPQDTLHATLEVDKFRTPYRNWGGPFVGGVEILATAYLNWVNEDWLRRPPWWIEVLGLLVMGGALGGGLCRLRTRTACWVAAGTMFIVMIAALALSNSTNYWFPWLFVAGLQAPLALAWSIFSGVIREERPKQAAVAEKPRVEAGAARPEAPDYELFDPPFGEGGFGKVWLVRNAIGQWQALKAVYRSKFNAAGPYESEFKGIERYKPVSEKHPGLLRIDFVSRMKPEGYFYYVMELGDAQAPDWEKSPSMFKPCDLDYLLAQSVSGRLPIKECFQIGLALSEALDFLHREGLTHRDIKPSNVIFVKGQPKLADVGLVSQLREADRIKTYVGSFGYMPPHPEPPGTVAADIYALGMLLYVASVGREPGFFPNRSTAIIERAGQEEFQKLDAIILQACATDPVRRFSSAAEMHRALKDAFNTLAKETTGI